jgi:hypothetical protein
MVFFKFDKMKWPLVKITLTGNIETEEDFNVFLHSWENLYLQEEPFTLLFDATNFGMISIYYSVKMTFFIKKLKKKNPQFLSQSLILLKGKWLRFLVNFMFAIEKPVAPVYVYYLQNEEPVDLIKYYEKISTSPEIFAKFLPSI